MCRWRIRLVSLAPQCSTTLDLINPCSTFSFFQSPTKHHSTRREVDAPADAPADARDQPKAASAPSFEANASFDQPAPPEPRASVSGNAALEKLATMPRFSHGTGGTPKKPTGGTTPIKLKKKEQRSPLKQSPKTHWMQGSRSPAASRSPNEARNKLVRRYRRKQGCKSRAPVSTPTKDGYV